MLYLSLDWQVRMQRELFQHRQTEFFEEPGGIAADRRYQIGCHVFIFFRKPAYCFHYRPSRRIIVRFASLK